MTLLRYAIIGCGCMGQEHIRNINLLDNAVVSTIAEPDEGMRRQATQLAGPNTQSFADYREMLSLAAFDALVVATPNHTHLAVMRDVLATGLPILVEKPLCTTVDACNELLSQASAYNAPIWVAMEYRYMPPVQEFLREIDAGTIGELKTISIVEHRYPFLKKVGDWNRFNENTGGTLVEKCCHFFDLMRLISGASPIKVYASGGIDVNHLEESYADRRANILDNAMVIVDFDNGIRGYLELCMFAEGSLYQEHITAIGDKAKLESRIPGPVRLRQNKSDIEADIVISPRHGNAPEIRGVPVDKALLVAGDHHGSTYFQHVEFNRIVRQGGSPEVTLEDGALAVAIGAAAEASANSGMPVELNL